MGQSPAFYRGGSGSAMPWLGG